MTHPLNPKDKALEQIDKLHQCFEALTPHINEYIVPRSRPKSIIAISSRDKARRKAYHNDGVIVKATPAIIRYFEDCIIRLESMLAEGEEVLRIAKQKGAKIDSKFLKEQPDTTKENRIKKHLLNKAGSEAN